MLTSCNSISARTMILIKVATSTTLIFEIHSELEDLKRSLNLTKGTLAIKVLCYRR
jgi:hypothetical protein